MKTRSLVRLILFLMAATRAAFAAAPFRLFEISTVRFVKDENGTLILDRGLFNALGEYRLHALANQLPAGTTIPAEAMNRPLLPLTIWTAYEGLGPEALANFDITRSIFVNGAAYFLPIVSDAARVDVGTVANLSTRATVVPGGDPVIGGFVVEDRPRRVLIRGIGPTLASFNVGTALANPRLTLFRQGTATAFAINDDWAQQANATDIETASAAAGAFALPRNSKDAVLLVVLPPGTYTAHLGSADATGGSALLEIYVLP